MLRNKLMTACCVAVLTAALYGCSSSSDDGANMQVQDLQDQISALEAALEEGQELTPEALAALIAARDAAEAALELALAAQEAAETARMAAEAAQMAAEGERDAANTAAEAAETARMAAETARMAAETARMAADAARMTADAARMTAEGERDTANMAAAAAATAQMTAEGERDTANMAAAAAATAQMTAEGERDTANMAAAAAATAQMTAEGERDTANMAAAAAATAQMTAVEAQAAAVAAQGMAEADRDAANMRATQAMDAAAAAQTAANEAEQRATAAAAAQMTAEDERDTANMRADTAATAQMTAEGERDTANMAAAAAATAQMTAEGERDTANMAAAAAATAQMTAEGERDTANMAAAAAATAQMTAEGERDTANMAAAAAATAQMTAEGERVAAITRADTADADLQAAQEELATANARVDEIEEDSADALAEAALKDRIAREVMVRAAFVVSQVSAMPNLLPMEIAEADLIVKRSVAGMVTVDVNGATDDVYTGGETTAGSGDWNSVTMTRTDAAAEAEHTLVIYTDIDAPADRKFNDKYDDDMRDNIFAEGDTLAAYLMLARSDSFPTGSNTTLLYGESGGNPKSFAGTFDGVPGNFSCTGTEACSITTNSKGDLMSVTGTAWRFSPHSNLETVKDPDRGYAYFGWWLNKPDDNAQMHVVEVFAGGVGDPVTIGDGIEGTARYSGPAAGKYVTKTFSAGPQTDAGVGHFTANANLIARFGDEEEPGSGISGSISGFVLDDTTPASWSVTLETATFMTSMEPFTGTTEVNFGGGATDNDADDPHPGAWQGSFYGAGAATDGSDAPDAVAGTFDAVTPNAAVIGGFGATRQ